MKRLLFIFLLVTSSSQAATFYVADSTNGDITGSWGAGAASDGNDGLSWANSWAAKFNDTLTVGAGDTVLFSTGKWNMNGKPLIVISGTADTEDGRTIYACSTYAEADKTTGDYNLSMLWQGTEITDSWTSDGGGQWHINSAIASGPLFTGDFFLEEQGSSSPGEGEWWSNGTNLTEVHLWDNVDPNTVMVVSNTTTTNSYVVDVAGVSYVTIWGLNLKYGNNKTVKAGCCDDWGGGASDYITLSHCKIGPCAGQWGSNPANIATSSQSTHNDHWRITACSLSTGAALNGTSYQSSHGGAAVTYSMDSLIVDSNWFYGYHTLASWFLKNDNNHPITLENVFRYNEFKTSNPRAEHIRTARHKHNVWIYGNTFISESGNGGGIIGGPMNETNDSNLFIYNNTFINVDMPLNLRTGDKPTSGTRRISTEFKYNVIYHTNGDTMQVLNTDLGNPANPTIIDSNIYFTANKTWTYRPVGSGGATALSITAWKAEGWDVSSKFLLDTDHDLMDPTSDLRRKAVNEMSRTYGSDNFSPTKFGAIQEPAVATGVNDDDNNLPSGYLLDQNYPNPFNPSTTIRFTLPRVSDYELAIYNVLGQAVKEFNGIGGPGQIAITWNAANNASGVYFYRLKANSFNETRKMTLLK